MIIFSSKKEPALGLMIVLGRRRDNMEKLLRCRDMGKDCDFEACGETAEEALTTAVDHARAVHG